MVKNSSAKAGDAGLIPAKAGDAGLLEEEMATHSSSLAWEIPWREECGGLESMGSQSQTRLSTRALKHYWNMNAYRPFIHLYFTYIMINFLLQKESGSSCEKMLGATGLKLWVMKESASLCGISSCDLILFFASLLHVNKRLQHLVREPN